LSAVFTFRMKPSLVVVGIIMLNTPCLEPALLFLEQL